MRRGSTIDRTDAKNAEARSEGLGVLSERARRVRPVVWAAFLSSGKQKNAKASEGPWRLSSAPDRIRTCDLVLRRHALYPAELRALDAARAKPDRRSMKIAKARGGSSGRASAPEAVRQTRTEPDRTDLRRSTKDHSTARPDRY